MPIDLDTLRGYFRQSAFIADLGLEPTAVEPGFVASALTLQPRFLQHSGVVHAGVLTTVADHSMGAAAQTMAAEGSFILTAEIKVSLLRAATGERLVCEARVLKPGRAVSFTEAEVFAESGGKRTLVLKASATMVVMSQP